MGFSEKNISDFYSNVFKQSPPNTKTSQQQWNDITSIMDTNVPNSRTLAEFSVPDPTRLHAVEQMIMNPASFTYNLFNNNCQGFINGIVDYINHGRSSPGFNDVANVVHPLRIKYLTDTITDLNSIIPSHLRALLHKRRRNPNTVVLKRF